MVANELSEWPEVRIIKEADDPICVRASIGGHPKIGYYLVYRGDVEDVVETVERVLTELKKQAPTLR